MQSVGKSSVALSMRRSIDYLNTKGIVWHKIFTEKNIMIFIQIHLNRKALHCVAYFSVNLMKSAGLIN